jgi:hypothetical protein
MLLDIHFHNFETIAPATQANFVKDILPLISTGLLLFYFIFDRYIGHKLRIEEKKRNWYFKAFFENSIKKIDDFFEECESIVKNELESRLKRLSENEVLVEGEVKDTRTAQEKLSDSKRRFEYTVLQVIQTSYPKLALNLGGILLNIEDEGIIAIESNNEDIDAYWIFLSKLTIHKSLLLSKMSEPALGSPRQKNWFKSKFNFKNKNQ